MDKSALFDSMESALLKDGENLMDTDPVAVELEDWGDEIDFPGTKNVRGSIEVQVVGTTSTPQFVQCSPASFLPPDSPETLFPEMMAVAQQEKEKEAARGPKPKKAKLIGVGGIKAIEKSGATVVNINRMQPKVHNCKT